MRRRFAEILERDIAAEAEADERDSFVARRRMANHRGEIERVAAVVKAQEPVRLAAASAEIPRQHVPARCDERARGAEHVILPRVAFEPVRENRHAPGAGLVPVEIDKVAVLQFQPLALEAQREAPREQDR